MTNSSIEILDRLVEYLDNLESNQDELHSFYIKYKKLLIEDYPYLKDLINREFDVLVRSLIKCYRRFNFPLEMNVIPLIKFSKKPIFKWDFIQDLDSNSVEMIKIRRKCSKLGNLLNYAYILKHFVVVDIDINYPEVTELKDYIKIRKFIQEKKKEILNKCGNVFDIETRRGFQKIFYIKDFEGLAVEFKRDNVTSVTVWTKIHLPESSCTLEIRSTRNLYVVYPETSHYLDVENSKLVAKKWKAISIEAKQLAYSNLLEGLKASESEITEYILNIIKNLDEHVYKSLKDNIKIKLITYEQYLDISKRANISIKEEKHKIINYTLGTLTYSEFKQLLNKVKNELPNCVRKILFENVERGYCYALARLACTFIFNFVRPTLEEVERLSEDFCSRFTSFKSPKIRYWLYFGFSKCPETFKIGYPTAFGVGRDVFEMIREYCCCDKCRFNELCLYYNRFVRNVDSGLKLDKILSSIIERLLSK